MSNQGWRKLMWRAEQVTKFLCPICDKPTPEDDAKFRIQPGNDNRSEIEGLGSGPASTVKQLTFSDKKD